jgi:hypothetical protein
MKMKLFSLIVFAFVSVVGQASATTVDFQNSYFSQFDGDQTASFVAGGVGITVQAFSNSSDGTPGGLDWGDDYGFGINGGSQSDEIDTTEELLVTFSEGVLLVGMSISKLYPEGFLWLRDEIGYYSFNGGGLVQFGAENWNGSLYLPGPDTLVTSIAFFATPGDDRNEFSVSGLMFCRTCADVPEPASMMLFGTGLIAFARLRRKKA